MMAIPNPAHVEQVRSSASLLLRSLIRELAQLEKGGSVAATQDIYNHVHLGKLVGVARGVGPYLVPDDWEVMCQPLHPDLARTQIQIVIELLAKVIDWFGD
jgi:hypothetical protein